MCEFCVKHGEGKKWYLQAKNYADDLASDMKRRRKIDKIIEDFENVTPADLERIESVSKLSGPMKSLIGSLTTSRMKKTHFGQVVPIEDVEQILQIVNSVCRVPCVCRNVTTGNEARYCLPVTTSPIGEGIDSSYWWGPDATGMEVLSREEALEFMRGIEGDGCMHSVWTFGTPFIGAICNCDRSDCLAMRSTVKQGIKVMFKAEYVASVNRDVCTGCRSCLRLCQFGAMGFSSSEKKAYIDELKCYGCGVCRAGCTKEAISLVDRSTVPAVANRY